MNEVEKLEENSPVKKQKIKRSTTKQLRNEAKQLRRIYDEDSKDI